MPSLMQGLLRRAVFALLIAAMTTPAHAQFGLERVVSNINVANLNAQGSCLLNNASMKASTGGRCGLYGWGLEVGLALSPDTAKWQYQFSVGYGQITGFNSNIPTFDLRGILRLQPEVSFYATRATESWFSPYAGIHTGIVTLSNVQVYTAPGDTIFGFSASAMQFGATVGVSMPFNLYADVGYRYRDFRAVEWRRGVLPVGWPKSIIMSVAQFTIGVDFDVGGLTGRKR